MGGGLSASAATTQHSPLARVGVLHRGPSTQDISTTMSLKSPGPWRQLWPAPFSLRQSVARAFLPSHGTAWVSLSRPQGETEAWRGLSFRTQGHNEGTGEEASLLLTQHTFQRPLLPDHLLCICARMISSCCSVSAPPCPSHRAGHPVQAGQVSCQDLNPGCDFPL
jgi:hypothetical protein